MLKELNINYVLLTVVGYFLLWHHDICSDASDIRRGVFCLFHTCTKSSLYSIFWLLAVSYTKSSFYSIFWLLAGPYILSVATQAFVDNFFIMFAKLRLITE